MKGVPSRIDLRDPTTAARWAAEANLARPYRSEVFDRIALELRVLKPRASVLELGSGPGYLAEFLLGAVPVGTYTLLDFSDAMQDLARRRIARHASTCIHVSADFSRPGWCSGLGPFDAIVTVQAVHELRHKRHAPSFHRAVRGLLTDGGLYLVCDHFAGLGAMVDQELYATIEEQAQDLSQAGFRDICQVHRVGSLVLHRAR